MMPFQNDPCNSAPMRPPTRRNSNTFTTDEDGRCFVLTQPAAKDLSVCSAKSTRSSKTCDTADESVHSEEGDSRRVRFALTVKRYLVESHKSFAKEEKSAAWYTQQDISKITSKAQKLATRMAARKPEKRSSPYRGLYCWTDKGALELEQQIFQTFDAVMDEQERQWQANKIDHSQMASVSRKVTFVSTQKALNMAYEDEIAATSIYASSSLDIFADDDSTVGSIATFGSKGKKTKKKSNRTRRKGSRKADHEDPSASKETSTTLKKRVKKKKKEP